MPASSAKSKPTERTATARRTGRSGFETWTSATRNVLVNNPRIGYALAFFSLVLALSVARFSIIDSPPYYDFATGLFVEADFLAEHNFDYARLVREERRWLEGGSAVYITSVMPTCVAILMKTLPSARAVLIVYHVFTFACTAAIVLLMFELLRPLIGRWGAALTAGMLVTAPLFSTQIDMLGMDLPMAACALATALCVARQQYWRATCWGAMTSLIKAPGRTVTSALVVYLAILLVLAWDQRWEIRRSLWLVIGANLVVVAGQESMSLFVASLPQSAVEQWSSSKEVLGDQNFMNWTPKWFPDQVAILVFSLVSWLLIAVIGNIPGARAGGRRWLAGLYQQMLRFAPIVLGWIVTAAMLVALSMIYCLPRYFMLILPFTYLAFGCALFWFPRWRKVAAAVAGGIILLNLANHSGRFYPAIPEAERTGAILERSRECLADHRSNIKAMQRLARDYPDATIISATPFVHFLSLPRLGYVNRPLHGYSLNRFTTPTFVSGMQLPSDRPRDVVIVYANNPFCHGVVPEPTASDQMLYDDRQRSPLLVFRRRWPATIPDAALRHAYEVIVLPEQRLVEEANQLAQAKQYENAIALYLRALAIKPTDPDAHYGAGFALVQSGRRGDGIAQLSEAIRLDPKHAAAHTMLGAALADLGRFEESYRHLEQATRLKPTDVAAWTALGKLDEVRQDWPRACEHFARALTIQPNDGDLLWRLGRASMYHGQTSEAVKQLRRALAVKPGHLPAAIDLAWLLSTAPEAEYRDGREAVTLVQPICETGSQTNPRAWDALAAAYAEVGQFDQAIATIERALKLADPHKDAEWISALRDRETIYRQHQPYRQPAVSTGSPQ